MIIVSVVVPAVMGRRLIHLALEIPIFNIPSFLVWIYLMLVIGGLSGRTP